MHHARQLLAVVWAPDHSSIYDAHHSFILLRVHVLLRWRDLLSLWADVLLLSCGKLLFAEHAHLGEGTAVKDDHRDVCFLGCLYFFITNRVVTKQDHHDLGRWWAVPFGPADRQSFS